MTRITHYTWFTAYGNLCTLFNFLVVITRDITKGYNNYSLHMYTILAWSTHILYI